MKYSNILTGFLLSISLCFMACTKEAPMGPEGPLGEQGDAGPKGETGEAGKEGEEGSAAIIVSDWLDVSFQGSAQSWKGTILVPEITQDILDKGDITIFYKEGTEIHELNYFRADETVGFDWMNQELSLGKIDMNSNFDASAGKFRYIIIPSVLKTTDLSAVGLKSVYETLALRYGIKD